MTTQGVGKHVVVGHLVESRHTALAEMANSLSGKLRNHFILKIAEACLEAYPITMTDYLSSRDEVGKGTPLKITIREDLYPRMYSRYKDLPHGIRSTVIMNLLNRYAELMAGAPEIVDEAVRQLDAKSLVGGGSHADRSEQGSGEMPTAQSSEGQAESVPEKSDLRPEVATSSGQLEHVPEPAAVADVEVEDPLMSIDSGL